jgi:hypothetical protein
MSHKQSSGRPSERRYVTEKGKSEQGYKTSPYWTRGKKRAGFVI